MGADYTDDLTLLPNTLAQAESQLHSQEQAAGGIGLNMNTNKTEFMCFKQGAISNSSGKLLRLSVQSKYLDSYITSTENNVNVRN